MIEFRDFSLSFKEKKVISSLNLSIPEKQKIALVGNNASGKTSLALFMAKVIPEFIPAKTTGFSKLPEKVSLVLQNPSNQFFAVSAEEELGKKGAVLAEKLGAGHLLERNVFELSEGEKQKINLISSLSLNPDVLLLDEPLELLDPLESARFTKIISSLKNETIVWLDKQPVHASFRNFFLSKQGKFSFPKKSNNASNELVLEAGFSIQKNSFSLQCRDFFVHEGEKVAIIGANGSGKTSFLKTIAGLNAYSGKILSQKKPSFAPQNPSHLFFNETVGEELLDKANAHLLGISNLLHRAPEKLSRGQQKLVSIAAVRKNSLVLLDEPTTWLDSLNKGVVYNFINESTDSMVISTHDRKLLDYCDRVFLIEKGVMKECSSTAINRFFQKQAN